MASIKRNYIYNTAYQILLIITPLITTPYLARVLGVTGVGLYSYALSMVSYFTTFAAFGTFTYGQRNIARNRDNKYKMSKVFWEIEIISLATTAIALLAWFIFIVINNEYILLYLILSMNILAVGIDISWLYSAVENFRFLVVRNFLIKLFSIILMFIFIKKMEDIWIYFLINSAALFGGNILLWRKLGRIISRINIKDLRIKEHIKDIACLYFVPTLAISIYNVLDKSMIGWLCEGKDENGFYEQTNKIINLCRTIIVSLDTVLVSRISYLWDKDQGHVRRLIGEAQNFILLLGIPTSLGLIAIADNFVPWFFGVDYSLVSFQLKLASPLILIVAFSHCAGQLFYVASGKQKRANNIIIMGACINFVLNLCMIPIYKSSGAIISTIIAELFITIMMFACSEGYFAIRDIFEKCYKKVMASVLMFMFIRYVPQTKASAVLITGYQILAGCIIYIIMLYILKDSYLIGLKHKLVNRKRAKDNDEKTIIKS